MVLGQHKRAVGSFPNRQDMEHAINELNNAGFSIKQISVIAKDADLDDQIGESSTRQACSGHSSRSSRARCDHRYPTRYYR